MHEDHVTTVSPTEFRIQHAYKGPVTDVMHSSVPDINSADVAVRASIIPAADGCCGPFRQRAGRRAPQNRIENAGSGRRWVFNTTETGIDQRPERLLRQHQLWQGCETWPELAAAATTGPRALRRRHGGRPEEIVDKRPVAGDVGRI